MGSELKPDVTIICMAYNHARFLEESIDSVLRQSYPAIELILVDDASTDQSGVLMQKIASKHGFKFIANPKNIGNCKSFNLGLKESTGKYIIDLAADDILLPERVAAGVAAMEKNDKIGVHYCDVDLMDENGHFIQKHSDHILKIQGTAFKFPSGDIYKEVIDTYFISAPSMMMRRETLQEMGGYNESLSYEDFDFWVRSARKWAYNYTPEVLVKKRMVRDSLSDGQMSYNSPHDRSTYKVCEYILEMNCSRAEHEALLRRITYEQKHALKNANIQLVYDYQRLKRKCQRALRDLP